MVFHLRCLPTCTLPGAWQMAIDAWLLERIASGARQGPLLRFYHWSQPTLSLGKHQHTIEDRWLAMAQQGRIALVRRPSGGSAVLHGGDLTYALLWPDPPRQRREAYRMACHWLQQAFAAMGQPLAFGASPCPRDQPQCFATSTAADLVHPGGGKRIGSAQLWRAGSLLQHGSVLLDPDAVLWQAAFQGLPPSLPSLPLTGERLEAHLLASALRWLPMAGGAASSPDGTPAMPLADPLTKEEWRAIAASLGRYGVPGFSGVGSADSDRALATEVRASPRG